MKAYNQTIEYVLYDLSYANLVMYGSVLPSYSSNKDGKKQDVVNADDPLNQDKIRKILEGAQ